MDSSHWSEDLTALMKEMAELQYAHISVIPHGSRVAVRCAGCLAKATISVDALSVINVWAVDHLTHAPRFREDPAVRSANPEKGES